MKTDPHPLEVAAALLLAAAEALLALLLAVVALTLVLAGYRPPAAPPLAAPAGGTDAPSEPALGPAGGLSLRPWLPPALEPLEGLPVAQLRRLARDAGLPRALTRTGRKADLQLALAVPVW